MDTSRVIAKAHIPQQEAALLKKGDPATVSGPGNVQLPAKVTVVSPALDPNSTTVEVWVEAPNPNNQLRPGSTVQLFINEGQVRDAVVIPASAVLPAAGGGSSVMVIASEPGKGDVVHPRAIQTGVKQGDQIQVVSGLQPGERVVTVGGYGLDDNTRVKIEAPSTASADNAEK
jgi:RND family efflux transporter MFP subunit